MRKNIFTIALAASFLIISNLANAGGLMVIPSRVELDDKTTSKEVRLINKGNETTTYRISFQHLRMEKDGSYKEITDKNAKENFADDVVRFSPKQVTLKPGDVQTIRLMFKKPSDLADGEYRSHLLMKEEAPADFGKNVEKINAKNDKKISVELKPLFGVSIPVVVTSGATTAKVEIKSASVAKGGKTIAVNLARSGNASVYGDLLATLTDKTTKKIYEIGGLSNVAVFSPYEERNVSINLTLPKGANLSNGTIEIGYYGKKDKETTTDKEKVLAKKVIN